MKNTEYKICSRCIMDSSDPLIQFNAEGICNHCNDFINLRSKHGYQKQQSDAKLNALILKIKSDGKGKAYDCVIGLSGGVDSSYLTFLMKQHGLRILGVHLDNGWNSDEAIHNIRSLAERLNIHYQSYVLHWEEFKRIQLAFLKANVPEADTPTDIAILSALHKVAAGFGIKHILSGGNFATEGILPASWHYNAKDLKYFKHIFRTFGQGSIKHFPMFGFIQETYYKLIKGIKMQYVLNYIDYDKAKAQKELEENLGWKDYGGKHHESRYTAFIQGYYLFTKFNIDYRRATLSSQICLNKVTRIDALEQLKTLPYDNDNLERDTNYVASKLEIKPQELIEIINQEASWYFDYPNSASTLNFVYNTYRKWYKKDKLASF